MLSPLVQKLLFVRQFSISDGKVEVLGNRFIMLDASNLLALQEIDRTSMYTAAKESARTQIKNIVGHAKVYKKMKEESLKSIAELSKKVGATSEGQIKVLQDLFDLFGLGKLEIVNLDNRNKMASLKVENSALVDAHREVSKKKEKVCTLTAGILAGIFSYIFGKKDINCVEVKCKAESGDFCLFEAS